MGPVMELVLKLKLWVDYEIKVDLKSFWEANVTE
jgi:hypothetical protein